MLGLLQGVSELFPISSLGHSVILPNLLGWNIHQNEPYFLTFLVAVHLATALVLLGFFWQDWVRIVKGLGRSLRDREITDTRREARLAARRRHDPRRDPRPHAAGLPAQVLRLAGVRLDLPRPQRRAALRRRSAAAARSGRGRGRRRADRANGGLGQERPASARRSRSHSSRASRARARRWAAGCSSASRTRTRRASPSCSPRRSFSPRPSSSCPTSRARRGTACAGLHSWARSAPALTAYLAVRFLMRYFETRTLIPFAVYCLCAGTACAIYFAVT